MQPIIIHRVVTTAIMPLVAMGGYFGYSHYSHPTPTQPACVSITQDLYQGSGNPTQVASLQQFLIDRGYVRGTPNGLFDQVTAQALARFQADNSLPASGYVDAGTRTLIAQMTCGSTGYPPTYNGGQIVIQGLDAPAQLSIGQTGTWTVRLASYPAYQSGNLHYQVTWGDENYGGGYRQSYAPNAYPQSSGTFTHVYRAAGTYNPTFIVTDDYGHSARTSATVQVYATSYGYPAPTYPSTSPSTSSYCTTNLGQYDRNCYNNGGYYPGGYTGPQGSGYPSGCTGYYDRSCYVNGTYIGPNASGSYVYNGPGDTCYYFNGQWQGNCNNSSFNYPYGTPTYGVNQPNPYGGPSGVDYSCYYDRACLARMNGTTY